MTGVRDDDRPLNTCKAKLAHEPGFIEEYSAGIDRPAIDSRDGISLSSAPPRFAREARYRTVEAQKDRLRAWLFLAPTSGVPKVTRAEKSDAVLDGQVREECQARRSEHQDIEKKRMEDSRGVAVPNNRSRQIGEEIA